MRIILIVAIIPLAGCAATDQRVPHGDEVPSVTYYDLNRDGQVDFEMHRMTGNGVDNGDWARKDTNYDGYYDEEIVYGKTISISEPIHMRVPHIDFRNPPGQKSAQRSNQAMQPTASPRTASRSDD
jgi:hypothetical protein